VKGRKRHLLVDSLGLVISLVVLAGRIQDVNAARILLEQVRGRLPRSEHIWADGGYTGTLIEWVASQFKWVLEIVKAKDKSKGFQVLPRRWVVERTFAWLGKYRRLSKDYEYLTQSSEAMIYLAMTYLMLRRLGLVLWIDNQYAAFMPSGGLARGALASSDPVSIKLKDIGVEVG